MTSASCEKISLSCWPRVGPGWDEVGGLELLRGREPTAQHSGGSITHARMLCIVLCRAQRGHTAGDNARARFRVLLHIESAAPKEARDATPGRPAESWVRCMHLNPAVYFHEVVEQAGTSHELFKMRCTLNRKCAPSQRSERCRSQRAPHAESLASPSAVSLPSAFHVSSALGLSKFVRLSFTYPAGWSLGQDH